MPQNNPSQTNRPARKKTTYALPNSLRTKMLTAIASDQSYGLKAKSKWIADAVRELIEHDPHLLTVGVGDDREKNDAVDVVELPVDLKESIELGVMTLRRREPLWAGPQAAILRAAVRRKLAGAVHPVNDL